MSSARPKIDWRKIDRLEPKHDDPGFTVAEYAERYEYTKVCAQGKLGKLVAQGKLVRGTRRMRDAAGRMIAMVVYRPA